ncbi:unnamed protein product [Dracunculus medinensis]|uniref:C-type lectin domain-containing protein n=1 Tax=Dracunculus medinensis TaxID=318479 RepID=A0A0N4URU9_DRAME|nr:unnamed protein product [Dracunculus medinensis]VDN54209.1 unnamed protein product [Dracunculus medinensis]
MLASSEKLTDSTTTRNPKECPLGWTYLSNQCIKIYPQAFDADRASIICQNTGAILLTLNEDDEMFNEMFKDTVDLLNVIIITF